MGMAHSSLQVGNRLLTKAGATGLDPMKLLKLTYLAQGWMLGLYGVPLIWNDVEAWRYGPVFREMYRHVAGKATILGLPSSFSEEAFDARESHLIDQIWEKYGSQSGLQLSALTHVPGSPWDLTYKRFGESSVIPKELIREYYESMANAGRKSA
jgi:uncharacterized phage-associated protein